MINYKTDLFFIRMSISADKYIPWEKPMHRKNHLILALIFLVAVVLSANSVFAWTASIQAQGEDVSGYVKQYSVEIGVDAGAGNLPAPPPAPAYSVKMDLYDTGDFSILSKDVRAAGEAAYMWILNIDPNGNALPPFQSRTSIIRWDPADLGSGDFKLCRGYDGNGPVAVADMKTTTSYQVTGTDDTQFTIHFSSDEVSAR